MVCEFSSPARAGAHTQAQTAGCILTWDKLPQFSKPLCGFICDGGLKKLNDTLTLQQHEQGRNLKLLHLL